MILRSRLFIEIKFKKVYSHFFEAAASQVRFGPFSAPWRAHAATGPKANTEVLTGGEEQRVME